MVNAVEYFLISFKFLVMAVWFTLTCWIATLSAGFKWAGVDPNWICALGFAACGRWVFGVRTEVEGWENLLKDQTCVYVANHQSMADALVQARVYPPNGIVIGKKEILLIPFFGLLFWIGGNVFLDRRNKERAVRQLARVIEDIKRRKVSPWIYPEGTRNRSGVGLLPFKKGAFHMAIQAQVPIVPVVCSSLRGVLDWRTRSFGGGRAKISILKPISTTGKTISDVGALTEQVRESMLRELERIDQTLRQTLRQTPQSGSQQGG